MVNNLVTSWIHLPSSTFFNPLKLEFCSLTNFAAQGLRAQPSSDGTAPPCYEESSAFAEMVRFPRLYGLYVVCMQRYYI